MEPITIRKGATADSVTVGAEVFDLSRATRAERAGFRRRLVGVWAIAHGHEYDTRQPKPRRKPRRKGKGTK
jgi:hypothetical protein